MAELHPETLEPTAHQLYEQNTETTAWEDSSSYILSLKNDANFIEYLHGHSIDSNDPTSPDYIHGLSLYTQWLVEHDDNMTSPQSLDQILLAGMSPHHVMNSMTIRLYEQKREAEGRLPDDEWNHYNELKKESVEYNQLLSNYMHTFDHESFSTISQSLIDSAADHFPHETLSAAIGNLENTLKGARTEAAARHLIGDSAGIPSRPATTSEDLQGADIVVQHNNRDYSIDIKSSYAQLEHANPGHDFAEKQQLYHVQEHLKSNTHRILLFPGFTEKVLGDSLRLSKEQTENLALRILVQLDLAIREIDRLQK